MDALLPFIISGLGIGAVYALSGVGLVVLYRASGVLNFAFGAIGALGAHTAWSVLEADGGQLLAWLAAITVAMLISFVYGRFLAPRLADRDITIRSVGTLGLALMLMGFAEWWWGEGPRRLVLPTDLEGIEFAEVRLTWTRILGLATAVLMMAGVGALLARTRVGLRMRALADDRALSAILWAARMRVLRGRPAMWVGVARSRSAPHGNRPWFAPHCSAKSSGRPCTDKRCPFAMPGPVHTKSMVSTVFNAPTSTTQVADWSGYASVPASSDDRAGSASPLATQRKRAAAGEAAQRQPV